MTLWNYLSSYFTLCYFDTVENQFQNVAYPISLYYDECGFWGCPRVVGRSIELHRMSDEIKYHSEVRIFSFSFLFYFFLLIFKSLWNFRHVLLSFFFLNTSLCISTPFHLRLELMNGSTMFACLRSGTSSDSKTIRWLSFFLSSLFPVLLLQFVSLHFVTSSRNQFGHFTFGKVHSFSFHLLVTC